MIAADVSPLQQTGRLEHMGTKPLLRLILTLSAPLILSMTVQSIYNIVDSYFVGQISEAALRSVSIVFPVQQLLIALAVGTGIGINSYLSRALGRGDWQTAESTAAHGFILNTFMWALLALFGFVASRFYLHAFSNDPSVIEMGSSYLRIVTIFSCGVFWEITLEKTLQASGAMVLSMILQMTGAVLNCILDPILIFGYFGFPALGVTGAGIATVVAQLAASLIGFVWVAYHPPVVRISLRQFRPNLRIIRGILGVGLPATAMMAIVSGVIMLLNALLRPFSEQALSVLGVYIKLQSLVYMPVWGLTQALIPLMGYNFGAHLPQRVKRAFRYGVTLSAGFMLLCMIPAQLIPEHLLATFGSDPSLIQIGVPALRIISLSYVPVSFLFLSNTLFQALGLGTRALIVTLLRQIVFLLPLAYVGAKLFGLVGIWVAFPRAEFLALGCTLPLLPKPFSLLHQLELEPNPLQTAAAVADAPQD